MLRPQSRESNRRPETKTGPRMRKVLAGDIKSRGSERRNRTRELWVVRELATNYATEAHTQEGISVESGAAAAQDTPGLEAAAGRSFEKPLDALTS